MLKVVIDTNVVVSGLLKPYSHCGKILEELSHETFELIISDKIFNELLEVIHRPKFQKTIPRVTVLKIAETIKRQASFVEPPKADPLIKADPSDDKFLHAAKEGKADFIVSGDHHLLSLKNFGKIPILSAVEFLKVLAKSR